MKSYYYEWFQKTINFFIFLFFPLALVSNLFVYTSFLSGTLKGVALLVIGVSYLLAVHFLKDRIRILLKKIIDFLSKWPKWKLLLVIIAIASILKALAYVFFFFDSTLGGGDITIYNKVADMIVNEGYSSVSEVIYYIVGMGSHLAIFKYLHIPIHFGIYLVFMLATTINFYAFSDVIGKEKSFIALMLYMLMPSTVMLTFCATHELFVYLYFSIIFYLFNCFFKSTKTIRTCVLGVLLAVFIILNQTVSPIAKIWFIVMAIFLLLTRVKLTKKIIIVLIFIVSLIVPSFMTTGLEDNYLSQLNNVEQLLIGADINSGGHHTDGRGLNAAKAYYEKYGIEVTYDNLLEGEIGALKETYLHLLTHPFDLFRLLANKFYTAWSGDFYSIELGHSFGGYGVIPYYLMLVVSGALWLVAMSIGTIYYEPKKEGMDVFNYKLVLLGIVAVLLIVEIANKYSCYMTAFIYLIAFARAKLKEDSTNG